MEKVRDFEASDLPERTKAALRLADNLRGDQPLVDDDAYACLSEHFTDDQILDLSMCITFASGWQRFIEAFGIVPDRWRDGSPPPWASVEGGDGDDGSGRGPVAQGA